MLREMDGAKVLSEKEGLFGEVRGAMMGAWIGQDPGAT